MERQWFREGRRVKVEYDNVIDYFHGIVNNVKQLEHQILVDQQLPGYISLADMVQYL